MNINALNFVKFCYNIVHSKNLLNNGHVILLRKFFPMTVCYCKSTRKQFLCINQLTQHLINIMSASLYLIQNHHCRQQFPSLHSWIFSIHGHSSLLFLGLSNIHIKMLNCIFYQNIYCIHKQIYVSKFKYF